MFVFHYQGCGGRNEGHDGQRHGILCNDCNCYDHIKVECCTKVIEPQRQDRVVVFAQPTITKEVIVPVVDYNEFLQFKAAHQPSSFVIVALSDNLVVFVSTSSSFGPWIIYFVVFNHMTGNKFILYHLSYSDSFPYVTMVDGSKIKVQGFGQAHPLPNLSLDYVLYIIDCPFDIIYVKKLTCILDCLVIFIKKSVYVKDRRRGRTIGTGSKSGGLYHLSPHVGYAFIASQSLTQQILGHHKLNKVCLLVPNFSKLSSFEC